MDPQVAREAVDLGAHGEKPLPPVARGVARGGGAFLSNIHRETVIGEISATIIPKSQIYQGFGVDFCLAGPDFRA